MPQHKNVSFDGSGKTTKATATSNSKKLISESTLFFLLYLSKVATIMK